MHGLVVQLKLEEAQASAYKLYTFCTETLFIPACMLSVVTLFMYTYIIGDND